MWEGNRQIARLRRGRVKQNHRKNREKKIRNSSLKKRGDRILNPIKEQGEVKFNLHSFSQLSVFRVTDS